MRLILIRHGKVDGDSGTYYGWSDVSLNDEGIEQSKRITESLKSFKIDAVFSSDLKRARHLAEMIARAKSLPLTVEKRIREMNFGEWEGHSYAELLSDERFRRWQDNMATEAAHGGESIPAVLERTKEFIAALRERYQDQTIVVVSHYGAIKCILMQLLHIDLSRFWSFHLDLGSISILDCDAKRQQLILFNDICHLGGRTCLP